ncbi:hypothetical protein GALMADRAFT_257752 [Galerina marginata CBS 339.88]|uniref:Jacalin-type lectin domain-containing protein n=1 Tax=Galerina marginata (strain CBS 339.88) TaxID=685588 RepID=A0A067SM63_GALM3|nr:hypothetical protein GALMADRAFT_257752 [Galerina marginata CBS 339.88]
MSVKDGPDLPRGFSQDLRGATLQSGSGGSNGRGGDIGSYNSSTQIDTIMNIENAYLSCQFHSATKSPTDGPARVHGRTLFRSQIVGHNGTDAGTFDDEARVSPQPGCPTITGISKIELQHGRWVHNMAVTYKLSNGTNYRTTHGQHMWSPFGIGFSAETIDLLGSEQIIAVAGRCSSYMVHELEFHIQDISSNTTRTVGPFGNCRAATWIPVIDNGTVFHCTGDIIAFAGTYNRGYGISPLNVLGGLSFICRNSKPELIL